MVKICLQKKGETEVNFNKKKMKLNFRVSFCRRYTFKLFPEWIDGTHITLYVRM